MSAGSIRYFQVLACVARADARLAPEERLLVHASAEAAGLDAPIIAALDLLADPASKVDAVAALSDAVGGMDANALAEVLRDAYVLAGADGQVDRIEIDVIESVMTARGIPARYHAPLHEWARAAAEQHIDGLRLLAEATLQTSSE